MTLTNCTIFHNTINGEKGGGIAINSGSATITFCTIDDNTATRSSPSSIDGGGIAITSDSTVTMSKSIVGGNRAQVAPDIAGTLISDGYNLIQNVVGATIQEESGNTDILGVSPDVGTLGKHGGPTETLPLLPGSLAIDRIPPAVCSASGITTDQRGVKRPQGPACDIGAYEYVPPR